LKINLNFYGFEVSVISENFQILELIEKNFSYFKSSIKGKKTLQIDVKVVDDSSIYLPKDLIASNQTINSITYNDRNIRYNDYHGAALSVFDYTNESAKVYGQSINKLHEIVYLIILSRQGKWSDLNGLHKIHAMAVSKNDKNLIVMMPMKGGKSTLFTKFLEERDFGIISDDTPMINNKGEILNFPIRFGLEKASQYDQLLSSIPSEFKFELKREEFGTKVLVDTKYINNRITQTKKKTILINGIRHTGSECIVKKVSKALMLKYLITHMIIGIGLPMVIEYFLETSFKDHFRNLRILLNRIVGSLRLLKNSECYNVYMTYNINENYKKIKNLL